MSSETPKWRSDFPIEWEGDHYVTRREMVKFLTLGSLILAAANWVTAFGSRFLRGSVRKEAVVGPTSELDRNGYLLFRYPTAKDPCIAARTADGKLVAYSQVCTHLSCAVYYSKNDEALLCPCHRGSFDLASGAPTGGPPSRPLAKINIAQRGDAIVALREEV